MKERKKERKQERKKRTEKKKERERREKDAEVLSFFILPQIPMHAAYF